MKPVFSKIQSFTGKLGFVQGLALGLAGSTLIAYATVTITTFSSGTTISSTDVNANFNNLKAAVEKLEVLNWGFVGNLATGLTLNCPTTTPVYPTEYVNPGLLLEGGGSASFFVIPTSGRYQLTGSTSFSGSNVDVYVDINNNPGLKVFFPSGTSVVKFNKDDVVRIYLGCRDKKGGKSPTSTINAAETFYSIKKL